MLGGSRQTEVINMNNELSEKLIRDGLKTRLIGSRLMIRPIVSSTMLLAREEIAKGTPAGTVLIAMEQMEGRGRLERKWLSPPGSLSLSIILYPEKGRLPFMIMISALAAACAVENISGLKTEIKWPNDVLVNDKKICGTILESGITGASANYAILGIGMNINMRMSDYPEICSIATSLSDQTGKEVSLSIVARELLEQLERWYAAVIAGEPVFQTWRDRLRTLGKNVTVKAGNKTYTGIAETVAYDGSILLRQADGSLVTIPAGDVTLRT